MFLMVVPYVGTWIEILDVRRKAVCPDGRSLRGNVDRNRQALPVSVLLRRRSLRGNVDRNTKSSLKSGDLIVVVPYVGTWIEI